MGRDRGASQGIMRADQQKRIPIPLSRRLKLLRTQVLPLVVFLGLVGVIVQLWREHVLPVDLIGEAMARRAEVTTPRTGKVVQLYVHPFSSVRHGDPLAVVMTTDPALLEAQLAVIRAEVDLLRHSLDPLVGRQRSDLDYERLRVELMDQRVAQATAEVRGLHAENHLRRATQLHADELISIADLEQAAADVDALTAELAGRRATVASLQTELDRLALPSAGTPEEPMLAAIRVHEERLRLVEAELAPVTLHAPLDGQVGFILRAAGEYVMAGEPLLTVMAETSDRVLAYLRQPLRAEPEVGMPVRIKGTSRDRGSGIGRVLHVAAQLEPLPEIMLGPGMRPEKALALIISLPAEVAAKPGERLEISFLP